MALFLGISHIAIAVPDIEAAWKQYEQLGYTERSDGIVRAEEFGVYAKVICLGESVLELLSPLEDAKDCPGTPKVESGRYSLDHICYLVENLDEAAAQLRKSRFVPITVPKISPVWGKRAVLLANRKMGVIELMEA